MEENGKARKVSLMSVQDDIGELTGKCQRRAR
jgi:hypothetical protein